MISSYEFQRVQHIIAFIKFNYSRWALALPDKLHIE